MPVKAEIAIRPASKSDLRRLSGAMAELPLFSSYGLGADALMRRWMEGRVRGDGLLVAEDDGGLRGICWFLPSGTFATGAYLRTLAVLPGSQGKGIGAKLLAAYEEATRAATGGWFLLASDSNEGAHRFYRRYGYVEVGRIPDFAKRGVTERVFWKPHHAVEPGEHR
jgi:ribosomal protein S18 acetylase RimI-like enzyme